MKPLTTDEIARIIRQHASPGRMGKGDIHGGQTAYIIYEDAWPHIAAALNRAYGGSEQEQTGRSVLDSNVRDGELIIATQTMDHVTKGRLYKVERRRDGLFISCDAYPNMAQHEIYEGPNGEIMGFTSIDEWRDTDHFAEERELLTKEIEIHKATISRLEVGITGLKAQRKKDYWELKDALRAVDLLITMRQG